MKELRFSRDADTQLAGLQSNPGLAQLYDRISDALDILEADPNHRDARQRRYHQPPLWGMRVHGSGEDWLILWSDDADGPIVEYLGPDL